MEEACNEINKVTIENSGETFPHPQQVHLVPARNGQAWKTLREGIGGN
jgi:hypothetical protein